MSFMIFKWLLNFKGQETIKMYLWDTRSIRLIKKDTSINACIEAQSIDCIGNWWHVFQFSCKPLLAFEKQGFWCFGLTTIYTSYCKLLTSFVVPMGLSSNLFIPQTPSSITLAISGIFPNFHIDLHWLLRNKTLIVFGWHSFWHHKMI